MGVALPRYRQSSVIRWLHCPKSWQKTTYPGWSDGLMDLWPGCAGSTTSSSKIFVFRYTLVGVIPTFNKGGSPKGLLSKWGIRVQAQSLLMTHPGKCWIKESVGQFLQAPDPGQDKKKKELTDYPTNSLYSLTNPLGSRISREYHNTYVTIRTAWLDFS